MVSYQERLLKTKCTGNGNAGDFDTAEFCRFVVMNSNCLAWSVYSECFKVLQGRAEIVKDAEFIFHTSSEA